MKNISSDPTFCFQLLKLPTSATESEIKVAYRILARQCHPDLNHNDPKAAEKFNLLNQAYQAALECVQQRPEGFHDKTDKAEVTSNQFHPPVWISNLSQPERCAKANAAYGTALELLQRLQDQLAWKQLQDAVWLDPTNLNFRYKLEDVALYRGCLRELEAFLHAVDRAFPRMTTCTSTRRATPLREERILPLITPPPKTEAPVRPLYERPELAPLQIGPLASDQQVMPELPIPPQHSEASSSPAISLGEPGKPPSGNEQPLSQISAVLKTIRSWMAQTTAVLPLTEPWQTLTLMVFAGFLGSTLTLLICTVRTDSNSEVDQPELIATASSNRSYRRELAVLGLTDR
ncbi:DnaJ domain-containing protein [Nodosilinea sp. LEGE 07088]|uniref:J domain-containing protein n=1 Tax=Nodosilinea sp. LEGE 07088 TaxID=2777968 RepID=UPI00188010F6|nr:J domain-containing protein [Nodosilinea sp. LEGE 07088]MBE9139140.1 DnaJ domain-containing protein [Nodosilinea sp. LEGE 07088]